MIPQEFASTEELLLPQQALRRSRARTLANYGRRRLRTMTLLSPDDEAVINRYVSYIPTPVTRRSATILHSSEGVTELRTEPVSSYDTSVFHEAAQYETAPFVSLLLEIREADEHLSRGDEARFVDEKIDDGLFSDEEPVKRRSACMVLLPLLLVILVYFGSSTASITFVKLLGYTSGFKLAVFFAILQKSGVLFNILVLPLFACTRKSKFTIPSQSDFLKYALIGFFSAAADVCDMFGLVRLQGSTYAILRTGDLIFNTLLSRFWLKKRFTLFHYSAVLVVVGGVVATGVSAALDADLIGVFLTLGGCFLEAFGTVASDQILKKSAYQRDDKLRYLFEYTMWVSSFALIFLSAPLLLTAEYYEWPQAVKTAVGDMTVTGFVFVCVGVAMSRLIVRLSKYWIVERRSAFTFAILKPVRRVFTVFVLILLFPSHENLDPYKGIGMALTVVGLCSYIYGSQRVSKQQRKALEAEAQKREQINE